jgi:uncharacterized protein YdeI (YjbR/CyaY-like superfamily)
MQTKRGEPIADDLAAALTSDPKVLAMWNTLRPSCQRQYAEWVSSAKRPETATRRIAAVLQRTEEWYQKHKGAKEPSGQHHRKG